MKVFVLLLLTSLFSVQASAEKHWLCQCFASPEATDPIFIEETKVATKNAVSLKKIETQFARGCLSWSGGQARTASCVKIERLDQGPFFSDHNLLLSNTNRQDPVVLQGFSISTGSVFAFSAWVANVHSWDVVTVVDKKCKPQGTSAIVAP